MGIKDWFKEEKKEDVNFPKGLKWIYVSLVCYFEGTKKEITKIAEDITNIIDNTHSIINEKGDYVGYINPYLNLNHASLSICEQGKITNKVNLYERVHIPHEAKTFFPKGFPDKKSILTLNLSRKFYPLIQKSDKGWKLTFVPEKISKKDETNLYSIENLNNDLWILAGASNLICEKYGILISEERPTYNPIMLTGAPAIELHDHLLIIIYHVHDRIASEKNNQELDKFVLGNKESIFDVIKNISKHQPKSEWVKEVKKLIEDEK